RTCHRAWERYQREGLTDTVRRRNCAGFPKSLAVDCDLRPHYRNLARPRSPDREYTPGGLTTGRRQHLPEDGLAVDPHVLVEPDPRSDYLFALSPRSARCSAVQTNDTHRNVLPRASTALIHERHRFGSSHISLSEPLDAKTGILDQFVDRAVKMTAT